jgi:hypothetical protein
MRRQQFLIFPMAHSAFIHVARPSALLAKAPVRLLDLSDMETGSLLMPMQAALRLCHPPSRPALPHFTLATPLQNDISHIEIP